MSRRLVGFTISAIFAAFCSIAPAQPTPNWVPLNESGTQGFGSAIRIDPWDPNTIVTSGDVFGAAVSTDGGQTWQSGLGMCGTAGNCPVTNDFTWANRTTVWAGTMAGPYLSTDSGHTWTLERAANIGAGNAAGTGTFSCPVQKVCVDPTNSAHVVAFCGNHRKMDYLTDPKGPYYGYAGNYGEVWTSTNTGASWTLAYTFTNGSGTGVSVNDACFGNNSGTIMYAATDWGLYKSTNAGSSWSPVTLPSPILANTEVDCVALAPTSLLPNTIWVGVSNGYGACESTDGSTWAQENTGMLTSDLGTHPLYSLAVAPSNPAVIYAAFWQGATYYWNNSSSSWTKIVWVGSNSPVTPASGVPGNLCFQMMSVDPTNPARMVGTGSSNVWITTNSGSSFQTITNYGTDSAYRGNGWSGFCGNIVRWNPYIKQQCWTLGQDSGKQMASNDYLWSWTTGETVTGGSYGPYNGAEDVTFSNDTTGNIYIATGEEQDLINGSVDEPIIKYQPGAPTPWSYLAYPGGATNIGQCINVYTNPANSSQIWAVYGNPAVTGRIYYTSTGGTTPASWTDITPSGTNSPTLVYNMAVNPSSPGLIYIGTNNGVYQSNAGGATFGAAMSGTPNNSHWCYVYPDPSGTNTLYAILYRSSSSNIFHYSGTAWSSGISSLKYAVSLCVDPHNTSRVVCVTKTPGPSYDIDPSTGIFVNTSSGSGTWTQISNGLKLNSGVYVGFNPDSSSQLIAMMDGGLMACDYGTSTAQSGTVPSVVGTINASTFDNGGSNVAYSGATAPSPATVAGTTNQWIKYEVNVPYTGNYNLTLNIKSSSTTPRYHVEFNGVNATGPMSAINTGGSWGNISANNIYLVAGTQYLKVYCEAGGAFYDSITVAEAGSLSGSTTATSSFGFNLTTSTPLAGNDWAKWCYNGVLANFDDKNIGSGQISNVTPFGTGVNDGAYGNSAFNVTWSDGSPVGSASDSNTLYSNASYNATNGPTGFYYTVPASTVSRTLTVFWGVSQGSFNLNAHLSDGSASDYNFPVTGPVGVNTQMYLSTITFKACAFNQTVKITMEKTANEPAESGYGIITNGSVDLVAAWVQ